MASSRLIIPLIHQTFRLGDYINLSLSVEDEDIFAPFLAFTISAITENEETNESTYPVVYPYLPNFELSN